MADNVIPMPDQLERIAAQINGDLQRREHSHTDWVEATLDLCIHLATARQQFSADQAFGRWCGDSGFGDNVISHQDRAAAIDMGRDPDRSRLILEKTERRSLRLIHDKEFRFTSDGKPTKPVKAETPAKPDEPLARALAAYDRRKMAGEDLTYGAIGKEAGVSSTPVRRAIAIRKNEENIEGFNLSATAEQKLDMAIRVARRKLEQEFETRVMLEAKRRQDEISLPHYFETLRRVERKLAAHRGVMPRSEYRKILACLHPDSVEDPARKPRFEEAFRLFNSYEVKLVSDDKAAALSGLPKTREEMMARKQKFDAARRAQRSVAR